MTERKRFDAPIEALLRGRIICGLILAVLITICLSFSSWRSAFRAEQDTDWVSHTYEVMATIQRTSRHVIEADTSARAFALTGEEPLLEHYKAARDSIYEDAGALRRLTADNLSQERRLDAVEPQVRMALEFADGIIAKRRKVGNYPGSSDALEVERRIAAVRATTQDMFNEETRLLSERAQTAAAGQRSTRIVAIVGVFFEVGLWVLAFLVVIRAIDISAHARAQLNTLNAELEQRVEERTAALREGEERFQAMANGISQLAWMAEADGSISWYNQRWYDYTGTTPEQTKGRDWQSVCDPEILPKVLDRWKLAIAGGTPFEMEFALRAGDGHCGMFLTRIVPLKDANGRVVRWFGTNTDISERKQVELQLAGQAQELARRAEELDSSRQDLERQTRMLQSVLDSMGEGLIAADRDGHCLIWNDAAKKLMGRGASDLPPDQWIPHYKLFLPDGITPFPPDRLPLVRALHGESVQVELMIEHPERADGVFSKLQHVP